MQSQQVDPINWHVVTSVLGFICTALLGMLYHMWVTRLDKIESKIDGIIKYLISTSNTDDKRILSELIGHKRG